MLKIENVLIAGWEPAIRGMRNPMNSWDKSDSWLCEGGDNFRDCLVVNGVCPRNGDFDKDRFCIGKADFDLMQKLAEAGSDHRKYMRMIVVYVDITAPLYWWKEFDTYKVGTVANSCSTMHKIHERELTLKDFSHEHLAFEEMDVLKCVVDTLNALREYYMDFKNKCDWYGMIQLLPSSYNQKRTVMMNYEVLRNIYKSRKNHKLDEWHQLCDWIKSLPYSVIITGGEEHGS